MSLFSKKERKPRIDREEALACIPVRHPMVRERHLKGGDVLLTYPSRMKPMIAGIARFLGQDAERLPPRKTQLDEMGSAVWNMMDGQSTVEDIIKKFSKLYQLHPKEAEVAVTTFFRQLGRRDLIALK